MIKINPLADRIIVRPDAPEEEKDGVLLPSGAGEKPQMGEVMETGSGKVENGQTIPMTVQKGDRVMFGKYSGQEISDGIEVFLVMRESDVIATIEEEVGE